MRLSCWLLSAAITILHIITLATSSPVLSLSTPDPAPDSIELPSISIPSLSYLHHRHLTAPTLQKRAENDTSTTAESTTVYGWVDYFNYEGTFISEDITSTNTCYKLMSVAPSNWSIVQVTPQTPADSFETDTLLVYTDDACTEESRDSSAQVLPMIIVTTYYRYRVPLSFKWVRYSTLAPNTTTTTTTPGSTSTHLTKTSTNPSKPTSTSTTTTAVEALPTATYRPSFQTSILPPKPSHWWNGPCGRNSTSCGTSTDNTTRNVIIVGVTVSLLALGFLAAGAYYIYRSFYSSPDSDSTNNITSSDAIFKNTRSNTNALNRMNPNSSSSSGTGDISGYNSSYVYNHDEDESVPPKFMFDHRHDNISTNRNPKLFKESPSSSRAQQQQNPSIHIPLQPRTSGGGQISPSSELSLLVRSKK